MRLKDQRGIALITALLLTLLSLTIILAVLYYISRSTELSAMHKRYKNVREASYGGIDVMAKEVIPQLLTVGVTVDSLQTQFNGPTGIQLFIPYSSCLRDKVTKSTNQWRSGCSTSLDPKSPTDMSFMLEGQTPQEKYAVYAKIVDTAPGNSDGSGAPPGLDIGDAVIGGGANNITPVHLPSRYRIEIQGEKQGKDKEKARLTVLYAY